MKNPSLLALIFMAVITGIGFVTYAYLEWNPGLIFLFTGGILGGSVLIFKKEINLWINQRSRNSLGDKELKYLTDHFAIIEYLPEELRSIFFHKIHLFCLDKEIISQDPKERIYHPAVLLCGAYAAFFEMNKPSRTVPFTSVPVYVFYGHPFPSPQFPQQLHISEYFEEDGALLFSVPHMIKGNEDPARFLNITLYESARVAMNGLFNSVDFPSLEKLCKFGGFTIQKLEDYLGLKRGNINVKALALTQFFVDVNRFTSQFPRQGDLFKKAFILSKS